MSAAGHPVRERPAPARAVDRTSAAGAVAAATAVVCLGLHLVLLSSVRVPVDAVIAVLMTVLSVLCALCVPTLLRSPGRRTWNRMLTLGAAMLCLHATMLVGVGSHDMPAMMPSSMTWVGPVMWTSLALVALQLVLASSMSARSAAPAEH